MESCKKGHKGLLIVIEGTDGSGKSTQIEKLRRWIEDKSYGCMVSEWKTSRLIANVIDDAKDRNLLNATTFSLLYAADFADRLENTIIVLRGYPLHRRCGGAFSGTRSRTARRPPSAAQRSQRYQDRSGVRPRRAIMESPHRLRRKRIFHAGG